jgi:3-hydroxyisobutyrate dehydrogenase-like beta-hydroxyacid dehydrogenase
MTETACFIGLGNMGMPMAKNLLKNGVKLFVYNRTKEKMDPLVKEGALAISTPVEAFQKAPIVFSMLTNDQALDEVSDQILGQAGAGCIHVSMSTVSPEASRKMAAKHKEKGVYYVSAPVFGRPDVASQASLWICTGGERVAKTKIEPLLKYLSKKIYDFGGDPAIPNAVKLTGNFMILSVIELLTEAFAFAEKNGVPLDTLHSFFVDSLFPSPVFKTYGDLIINQKFSPAGFKMSLGLKDIDLFLKTADQVHVPTPIASLLRDRLLSGLANHREDLDWSAISLTSLQEAGINKG